MTTLFRFAVGLALLFGISICAAWRISFSAPGLVAPVTLLRLVDDQGAPLVNATVRLLCYPSADALAPFADLLFTTDDRGYLVQPLPDNCAYTAALQRLTEQPAAKPGRHAAYTVYNTSWAPGARQLHPTTGDLQVRADWRLVLFDLAVSLEWSPPVTSSYTTELYSAFLLASAYLYDLTDGQMAFGPFATTVGGAGWESADFRVRAANDYRPTAQVGGIVPQPITYTTGTGKTPVFAPGEIWVGRYWDGIDSADPIAGAWTAPAGYRTLVHEWLHYALFLYDEYQDLNADGRVESYCTCRDLPHVTAQPAANVCQGVTTPLAASALAYHYTASELWRQDLPAPCTASDHYRVHGASDWATLERWSAIQGLPTEWLRQPLADNAGPDLGLAADLFGRRPTPASAGYRSFLPAILQATSSGKQATRPKLHRQLADTQDLTITLALTPALPLPALQALHPQLYTRVVFSPSVAPRLTAQGSVTGPRLVSADAPNQLGEAQLVGVTPTSLLYATVDRYGPRAARRGHFTTPPFGQPLTTTAVLVTPDPWPATLDITPGLDGAALRTLTVTLASRIPLSVTPLLQLCTPAAGCPTAATQPLLATGPERWRAVLTATAPAELPHYALLQVTAPGVGQLTRWFQAAGGVGPAHVDQHAPVRDGLLMVDAAQPLTQSANLMTIMPAADLEAVLAPLPPGIDGVIGQPLDLDLAAAATPALPLYDRQLPVPVILTLFYNQHAVDRLLLTPEQLTLLHYQRQSQQWQVVPVSGHSTTLHWLATEAVTEDGIYAVGYAQTPNFGRVPQKFADPGPVHPGESIRYLLALPAGATISATVDAFIFDQLPPFTQLADGPTCSRGDCHYAPASHTIQWQGQLGAGDLLLVTFTLIVDPALPPSACVSPLVNRAVAFDGAQQQTLSAATLLQCEE